MLLVLNGSIAQLGEHPPYKREVTGSSPVTPIETRQEIRSCIMVR